MVGIDMNYFVPGKVVLQVQHPAGISKGELLRQLAESALLREFTLEALVGSKVSTVSSFPPREPGNPAAPTFSVLTFNLREQDPPTDIRKLMQGIFEKTRGMSQRIVETVIGPIRLQNASPCWLVAGSNHQIGIGGPAGTPEPDIPVPAGSNLWKFSFPLQGGGGAFVNAALRPQVGGLPDGTGINVIILDTAPPDALLAGAAAAYPAHDLVQQMLAPYPGRLAQVQRLSAAELAQLALIHVHAGQYRMSDHGLFVAGIINSIAPGANLKLYEVLNDFGVGSIETIGAAMEDVLVQAIVNRGQHTIVNCSLSITFDPAMTLAERQYHGSTLEQICVALELSDLTVVAAAGNDNELPPPAPRNDTRCPAAYASVIGVGALKNVQPVVPPYEAALYSNLAFDPLIPAPRDGFVTYGGETTPGNGVLGIYLGKVIDGGFVANALLQPYRDNVGGWARWAGTSFATAVASGILALQAGRRLAAAVLPLDVAAIKADLRSEIALTPAQTVENEPVIIVRQG